MKKIGVFCSLMCMVLNFNVPTQALAKKKKSLTYAQSVSLASVRLMGRHKTVGSFVRVFKPHIKPAEYRNLKKTLASKGVSLGDKMPRVRAKGDKIFIEQGGQLKIKSARAFSINGKTFRRSKKDFSNRFKTILSRISKKQKRTEVSLQAVLAPQAHAFGDVLGIVALIGAGFAGYYAGPELGLKKSSGAILGVGAMFLLTEIWQSFKKDEITCTKDGKYQIRKKGRNSFLMAKSEQNIISDEKIEEAGLAETCTSDNADALKEWSEGGRLEEPAEAVEETGGTSNAIYGE